MTGSTATRCILFSILLLAVLAGLAPAAPGQQGNMNNDIVIGTRVPFPSRLLGNDLVLSVHLPPGYDQGTEKYPVLYDLNSSQTFAHDVGTVDYLSSPGLGYVPQMIVVGIPWLSGNYVPTPFAERGPEPKASDLFLKMFREELIPFIDRTYRTCDYNILSGHSVGGLFTTYALFTQPDLFSAGIASSPYFETQDRYWLKNIDKMFQAGSLAHKSLFPTVGKKEWDPTTSTFTALEEWMRSNDLKGLAWKSAWFEGHDHMSMIGRSLYDGLLFIFDQRQFPARLVRSADIPAIEEYTAKIKAKFGGLIDYKVPEDLLATFGDMWLAYRSYDKVIGLASLSAKLYPEGWKPHYLLGEAFLAKGDEASARKNYELAAAKNPGRTDPEKIMLQITRAKLSPSRPTAEQLALYAGDYGQSKVSLENEGLLYRGTGPQFPGSRPYRLIPLTETLFALDGYNKLWLEFVWTDGKVTALVGLYDDGRRETSPRSE